MRYFTAMTLLTAFLLAIPAQAYVLPTDYILRLMLDAQAKHKVKDASFKLTTDVLEQAEASSERLYLKVPERLRLLSESDEKLYVEREGSRAEGTTSALTKIKTLPTNLLVSLRFPAGKKSDERIERVLTLLNEVGIDTSITALGRFEGETVYIIGARTFEPDAPQVWVSKERLLPIKTLLFTGSKATGQRTEYRFLDYGGAGAPAWFPGVTELWRDGQLVKKQTVSEARVNEDLPETLFEVP